MGAGVTSCSTENRCNCPEYPYGEGHDIVDHQVPRDPNKETSISTGVASHDTWGFFSWLGVSPPTGSLCCRSLRDHFPSAIPGRAVQARVSKALRRYGINPENTLYGESICPDEINHEKGDLASLMSDHWGEVFHLGGLGGAPSAGKTGFDLYSKNAPEGGHLLILFGPHIAISNRGEMGKYLRAGQSHLSTACGTVLSAYEACRVGSDPSASKIVDDMQHYWMQQQVAKHFSRVKTSDNPLVELMMVVYEAIRDELLSCVHTDFGDGKLILLGGIQINMPEPYEDHFAPLMFNIMTKGQKPKSLLFEFGFTKEEKEEPEISADLSMRRTHGEVFSWLCWSPQPSSPCHKALTRCFPKAIPGTAVLLRSAKVLRAFGLNPTNTIYGTSICPDEINFEKGDFTMRMKDFWGTCFPFGGIGGAPFVGKAGFNSFSSHVPDGGHALILFGPHVAVSDFGEIGKYLRNGHSGHSRACLAICKAYEACKANGKIGREDPCDAQQNWLKQELAKRLPALPQTESAEVLADITLLVYEAVREKLLLCVHNDFGDGNLVLIGGIQINMPEPSEDHFLPLMFQLFSKTRKPINLLPEFF